MKKRKKLLNKVNSLKSATTQDIFTELMKRIPKDQRFCLFIQLKEYKSVNVAVYDLHATQGVTLAETKPIRE